MLAGLVHGKLDRYFTRNPYDIEDLLTSVVIGACRCVSPARALLPFLATAHCLDGTSLAPYLEDVVAVEYEFWPNWGALSRADEYNNDDEPSDLIVGGSEPEVVLTLHRTDGSRAMLLLEAKLHSSKSSWASDSGPVTDQLAKYWLHLEARAAQVDTTPLGIVYLTTQSRMPRGELEASRVELQWKGASSPLLFWTSWRTFCGAVPAQHATYPLDECLRLLEERWNLVTVQMEPWNKPPIAATWHFEEAPWWTVPPSVARSWQYGDPNDRTTQR